jgi:hypothetical protein
MAVVVMSHLHGQDLGSWKSRNNRMNRIESNESNHPINRQLIERIECPSVRPSVRRDDASVERRTDAEPAVAFRWSWNMRETNQLPLKFL